jgi:hypothetical protein
MAVPFSWTGRVTFVDDRDSILVTEDQGDSLHDQLNKLDAIWAYKVNRAFSAHKNKRSGWSGNPVD